MPSKPLPYVDMPFPVQGIDLQQEHDVQPEGTTRSGINVMTYEPSFDRSRGGSRPGLLPYVTGQVPTMALIQHINFVADPRAIALLADVDVDDPLAVNDPSTNPPGSNPNDPSDNRVRNPTPGGGQTRVFRFGGSGVQPNRHIRNKKKTNQKIVYIQSVDQQFGTGSSPPMSSFPSSVLAGDLVIAVCFGYGSIAPTFAVTDSLGNFYASATSTAFTAGGSNGKAQIFYAISGASGGCTVTLTGAVGPFDAQILMISCFRGASASPLDAVASSTGTGSAGTTVMSPGPLATSSDGELAVAAFICADGDISDATVSPGFTRLTAAITNLLVEFMTPVDSPVTPTSSTTTLLAVSHYEALGASFEHA